MPFSKTANWIGERFSGAKRGLRGIMLCVAATVPLAGCYDMETTIAFKSDGTTAISGRFDFPRDAEHVAKFYGAILDLQPQAGQLFKRGLCEGIGDISKLNPAAQIDLQAREYRTETRYGCGVVYQAGDSATFVDKMAGAAIGSMGVVQITREGARRVRVELDFNNMPDVTKLAPGLIMLGMMQQQQKMQRFGQPFNMPSPQAIDKATKAYVEASLAIARMSFPNNHFQLAIQAPTVVETNGEQQGNLVVFRWSWEEFTRLLLKPQAVQEENKNFYAIIEY